MSKFLVYRASAGSGKTFMLVRKYLQQIFESPGEYRRILAVTFTNKAADEMKGRILAELHLLDTNPHDSKHLDFLSGHFSKSERWVQQTAGIIKSQMLHDFTRISVGTIDSFFQQVLRAFARESGLSSAFQIELDMEMALEKFTRYIFRESTTKPALMGWLVDWVNERMENQEPWHKLEGDLIRLGKELMKEEVLNAYMADPNSLPKVEDITAILAISRRLIREFNDTRIRISADAAAIIESSQYTISDFSNNMKGPAGYLLKLGDGKERSRTTALESRGNPDKWVTKKHPYRADILANMVPPLDRLMVEAMQLFEEKGKLFNSARAVYKNLFALGFSSFLFEYIRTYFDENNQLLINLTQPIVNQIIGENPSPFIFEKTGTWYRHFLIDEFQDTSDLQWKNFKPLLVDSLSTDGLSMIVGDIKQSLYRWRNSNWRLLHEKAVNDMKPFASQLSPLDTNQRSRKSIIDFNNRIFTGLPARVGKTLDLPRELDAQGDADQNSIIEEVFAGTAQDYGGKSELPGRVEVRFLDKRDKSNNWKETLNRDLPLVIADLLENKGYKQEDITFLVRKNNDGDRITEMLAGVGKNWTFISSDVFRIGNSPVIKLLINAMRYLANPEQVFYRDIFLWETFLRLNPGQTPEPGFQAESQAIFEKVSDALNNSDLLTIVDELIQNYSLDTGEADLAYIFQFRDQVKTCMNKGISHPDGFVGWWDASGHKQMLASESLGDSMRIMTIHKAKGLSSPVIIIPYCNWEFTPDARMAPWLWVSTAGTPFDQISMIPVKYDSVLAESCFTESYIREKLNSYLDSLNLLYVAFTRAIDVLIVFCPYGNTLRSVAEALHEELAGDLNENGVYCSGDPGFRSQRQEAPVPETASLSAPMISGKLKNRISHRAETEYQTTRFGNQVHQVLERVYYRDDLAASIRKSVEEGVLSMEEGKKVELKINQILDIQDVGDWFSGNWEVLAEPAILVPGKGERRPDRVVMRDGRVVVIDYKTGVRDEKHHRQVQSYMELIAGMGYSPVSGYLLYLEDAELVLVRFPADSVQVAR